MNQNSDLIKRGATLEALHRIRTAIERDGSAAALELIDSLELTFQMMPAEKNDRTRVSMDILEYWKERALAADRSLAKVMEAIEEVYRS